MPIQLSRIEKDLTEFRTKFRSIHVRQDENYLVYNYKNIRHASVSCSEANLLIEQLNLPLVAIHNQNDNSFVVQSNEIADI